MPLFDSDFLKKLEYLSLVSRRVFRGSLLAQRRTMQFGAGIEFADHREYTAGDDLRYLDWNVYARHGDLLLKRFQEEEDLHVYFLLDCSRSMGFGKPPKFDLARQVTAALAYIALADLDRIGVIGVRRRIVDDFPLTRGKARILLAARVPGKPRAARNATRTWRASLQEFVRRSQRLRAGRRGQRSVRSRRLRTRASISCGIAGTSRTSSRFTTRARRGRRCSATWSCTTSKTAALAR